MYVYSYDRRLDDKYSFQFSADGKVVGLIAQSDTYNDKNFTKAAPKANPEYMNDLKDRYVFGIKEAYPYYSNGILRIYIPRDGTYILIPISDKEYVFPNWPGYSLKFITHKSNNFIKRIEYNTPDGVKKFKAPK